MESNENNDNDENMDFAGATPHASHEDGGNVEAHAQTKPISPNNAANRRVKKTEVVSGDVKFECQDCERTFNSQQALRSHTKSKHEGVKYACNQCDQLFTAPNGLTQHIQSVREGVKYACDQCDYQATQQGHLKAHIKRKHIFRN